MAVLVAARLRGCAPRASVVVHHNLEADLHRGRLIGWAYSTLQTLAARQATWNLCFSARDAARLPGSTRVCLPLARRDLTIYANRTAPPPFPELAGNYVAVPSNLAYPQNVSGLIRFYRDYRARLGDTPVLVSSPGTGDATLEAVLAPYPDQLVHLADFSAYLAFLTNARAVVLPVFEGSGVQLKALDALLTHRQVFASDLIIGSQPAFASFSRLDELCADALAGQSAPPPSAAQLAVFDDALATIARALHEQP
jgi:hypothetical protein